jgi:hypothetical protein
MKRVSLTININPETLDEIRAEAVANYRSINKQLLFLIDYAVKTLKEKEAK